MADAAVSDEIDWSVIYVQLSMFVYHVGVGVVGNRIIHARHYRNRPVNVKGPSWTPSSSGNIPNGNRDDGATFGLSEALE